MYIPKHILSDEDKAFVPDTNPTVPEHRLIMARHIGRMLRSDEIVHHINGIKDDNRIENLIIVDAKEHGLAHASVWAELVSLRNRVNELERINASSN